MDLIEGLPEYSHIVIHGKRDDTPANFVSFFPATTTFYAWKHAKRAVHPLNDFLALKELISLFKNLMPFTAVHLHSSKAGFIGRLAARILGIHDRVVYTPHGVSFLRKDISNTQKLFFTLLEKVGYSLGGQVIACSPSEAQELQKHKIAASCIPNGVRLDRPFKAQNSLKDRLIIGTLGRITPQKVPSQFNDIAQAFQQNPQVHFMWIGDGELRKELTSPNIQITGWLSRAEAEQTLETIDIYLSTSQWEGLPLSVLRAMSLAKPLILSNCTGNRDLVVDGFNGFLFEHASEAKRHISFLLKNLDIVLSYGEKSRELVVSKYSLDQTIEQYKKLYQRMG